jgi:hypothetical protein
MFFLLGSFGFVSAEKMWNFNNHSLNVSDNIFSGGDINVTSGGDVCIIGGMCLSEAGTGSGGGLWNESGSYLYPADLSKNVGIGMANPLSKLDVQGTVRASHGFWATNGLFIDAEQANGWTGMRADSTDTSEKVEFFTADVSRLLIGSNGNVGIGLNNPSTTFEVRSTNDPAMRISYSDSLYSNVRFNGFSSQLGNSDLQFVISTNSSNPAGGDINIKSSNSGGYSESRIFIDGATGNVGIGNDNPSYDLDVKGSFQVQDSAGTAYSYFRAHSGNSSSHIYQRVSANDGGPNSNSFQFYASNATLSQTSGLASSLGTQFSFYHTDNRDFEFYNYYDSTKHSRVFIEGSNGRVGIGTTSPTEMLTLNGSSPTGYPTISLINTINPSEWHIWPIDAGDLRIRDDTNSLDVMTFDQGTGRVGIGTTGPTYDLDVSGNGRFTSDLVVQGDVGIGDTTPNKPLEVKGVARVSRIGYDQNYIDIESPSTYQRISSSNNLLIDSGGILSLQPTGGYVGIGIDPPLYDLDVSGTGYFSNAIGVGVDPSSTYSIYANNGRAYGIRAHGSTMGGRFEDSGGTSRTYAAYGNYGIYTNLGSMNYFLGDVGIGITSPTVALDVSGAGEFTSSVTASAFYYSSDKELKMDVKKINSALEDIKKLEGIEFKWKENGEKSYGLIAQDVEKIYPELVGTREVFNETTNETKTYKTVQYGNLVAPLIESVKELDEKDSDLELEIRNLEEEVMGQEKRIEELERELDELKKLVLNGQEDLLN